MFTLKLCKKSLFTNYFIDIDIVSNDFEPDFVRIFC